MLKVIFFIENGWAFGSIHHGLCKELYKYGIFANLLDWTKEYSRDEFELLNSCNDLFVTNAPAAAHLYNNGIPFEKIIIVAHGQLDLLVTNKNSGVDIYNYVRSYAVISNILRTKSFEFGIKRDPNIVRLGIHFDYFYSEIKESLTTVGYGGHNEIYNFFGEEIKRGKLIENTIREIEGIQLVTHGFYNHLCMPGYYKKLDALVMASTEEAGGLPVMEAAASGKLILGTPVGYFEENALNGAGILLPIEENNFSIKLKEHLNYYRDNPVEYKTRCQSIQQFAKENYDWKIVIEDWVNLLSV